MAQAATLRLSPVLVRATVWSLIGMIYAPLYLVLAGLGMGTLAGTALLAADRLAGVMLPTPVALAFLVCVTGVLYVSVLVLTLSAEYRIAGLLSIPLVLFARAVSAGLPFAAMFAGAVAGGLLELFEFDWVDRA